METEKSRLFCGFSGCLFFVEHIGNCIEIEPFSIINDCSYDFVFHFSADWLVCNPGNAADHISYCAFILKIGSLQGVG